MDSDPIVEIRVNLQAYQIEAVRSRVAWQEELARIVANAHLCTFLVRPGFNSITFVGTKSHATVAEYVYGTLTRSVHNMSLRARVQFHAQLKRTGDTMTKTAGYREAWIAAFVERIRQRFEEARREAVKAADVAVDLPVGSQSQALIRLNGAMTRVNKYIDDKFKVNRKSANALAHRYRNNAAGSAAGRAAADSMAIGRRAVAAAAGSKGMLK
jgi:hypothetical protein